MFSFTKTALVALTLALGLGTAAQATSYKTVTVWVSQQVPYTVSVKKYDHHGCAYWTNVTRYKTIQVPVKKYVPVSGYSNGYGY